MRKNLQNSGGKLTEFLLGQNSRICTCGKNLQNSGGKLTEFRPGQNSRICTRGNCIFLPGSYISMDPSPAFAAKAAKAEFWKIFQISKDGLTAGGI